MSLINFSPVCGSLNINVENCTLGWCGGNAIGSDYGYVTNFNIINNEIGYCGNYGVAARMAGPVVVSNNYIHDCGLITWQAPGVRVSTNATVIQNNLFNFHTSAIADHDVDNCRFLYNSISNCMTTEEDMGGYYQYFGSATAIPHTVGNIIRSNLFQSVGTNYNVSGGDPRNFYRPAVYLDEQSSNTVVDHNITLGCPTPFFCNIAHSNAVLNNVFVNTNTPDSTGYAGWVRMYASSDTTQPNLVGQNVYYACGKNLVDNPAVWGSWAGNLFWSTTGLTGNVPAGATIANPLFTGLSAGNVTYQSGSVAPGLGIIPLTFAQQTLGVGNSSSPSPSNAVITWANPASIVYGPALSSSQLDATANVPGTFFYTPALGAVLPAGSQTLSVTFTPSNTALYNGASATVTLSVLPAALTVTATSQSKTYGAALPALSATYSGFVNGDTAASLTTPVSLATPATAASPVGSYSITASGAAGSNYTIVYVNNSLTVTRASLTITANSQSKVYGAALPALTAGYSGFVNGDTAASLTTPVTLATTATAASPVGSYSITASGAAGSNYTIVYVNNSLTVTRASLTITANSQSKVYGAALPALTAGYSGFVNGDTAASLTTPVTLATTATAASPVGSYSITASGAAGSNYTIVYVNSSITVTRASLTITANNLTKMYGAALPALTASYSGFVNGDTTASLTIPVSLATTATASSPIGTYPITAAGATSPNYAISFVNGTLTVAQNVLTITANNQSKVYGAALPTLTASYSGFINGDTVSNLTTPASLATTATTNSPAGSYSITASGAASSNYTIVYVNGSLTVTPASLTITANNQSKVYGAALPALTASYSGFINGDTVSNLTTPANLATTATAGSPAGSYSITARSAASSNYTFVYVNGSLTVTPARLTISANNESMCKGSTVPALTATYASFVNGDTTASLSTPASLLTTATSASAQGTYPIVVNAAGSANYTITFVNGALTVTAPQLVSISVTAPTNVLCLGQSQQLAATGVFTDQSTQNLSSNVTWLSSASTVASISTSGLSLAVSAGAATLSAQQSNVVGSFNLTVASSAATTTQSFTNSSYLNIPTGGGVGNPYPSSLVVAGVQGTVSSITVGLGLFNDTFPTNTAVLLVSPAGQSLLLMANAGGTKSFQGAALTFSGAATAKLPLSSQITSGTYLPTFYGNAPTLPGPAPAGPYSTNLSVFNGISANGTWTLFVLNCAPAAGGSIGVWTLNVTTTNAPAQAQAQVESFTNSSYLNIPTGGGGGNPYPSSLVVSGLQGTVSNLTVGLSSFNATFPTNTAVLLVSPAGQSVVLMANAGGTYSLKNAALTFSGAATARLPLSSQITSGTYLPTFYGTAPTLPAPAPVGPYSTNLSVFNGISPNGTWTLFVENCANAAGGYIGVWTLNITTTATAQTELAAASSVTTANPVTIANLMVAGGQVQLTLQGQPGQAYLLESSTDLLNWQPLATNALTDALSVIVDPSPAMSTQKFYRLK
jgi:subtilisin-like proprotein convertase family protein/arylamine N-acetyltransferase